MKNLENKKELMEEEAEKVAGGLPYIIPHHFPITQPSEPEEPQKPAEPEPAPGPMGQQATFEENQQAALNLHFSNR